MSTRVASLYAEIGAKTDGLKAGLASMRTGLTGAKAQLAGFAANAKSSLASAGTAWSDLATPINQTLQILGQVGQAAQQAYQFVSEGTQLATTAKQFDALSRSIGTTADALLGELKTATRGTISDAQLMASATSIMSLGLADTSEETVRLASLVGKLGWDMNQVTLTIANQSKMRLDSLGLSVRDVEERVDALRESGLSADQAFKFAIIEAGEAKVELLGDAAETAAGKLKILEANAANAGDSFKMAFSQELVSNVNDMAGGLFEASDSSQRFADAGVFLSGVIYQWLDPIGKSVDRMKDLSGKFDEGVVSIKAHKGAVEAERAAMMASLTAIDDRREAIESNNAVLRQAIELEMQNAAAIYRETSPAYAELQDKITQTTSDYDMNVQMIRAANLANEQLANTIPTVTGAVYASGEAIAAYTATTGDYATMAIQAQEQGLDLNQVMYDSLDAAGGSAEALVGLALATGQLTEAQAENILKQAAMIEFAKGLGEQIAAGTISINDAVTSLSNFEAGLESSNALINTATGSVILMDESLIGAGSSVGSLQTSLDTFTTANAVGATQAFLDKLNSIPRTVDVQVNVHGGEGVTAHGGYQNPDAGATSPPTGGGNVPQYASGGSFVVPAGFPAGRPGMQIGVHSGEEVNITPPGQSTRGGDTYNVYLTPANPDNVIQSIHYLQSMARA